MYVSSVSLYAYDGYKTEIFLDSIDLSDYSFNDQELIQQFLEKYPGPLKSYSETHIYDFGDHIEEQEISGAFILWDACFDVDQEINCKILLTLLELRSGLLTNDRLLSSTPFLDRQSHWISLVN